jgi:hypothetical protein
MECETMNMEKSQFKLIAFVRKFGYRWDLIENSEKIYAFTKTQIEQQQQ